MLPRSKLDRIRDKPIVKLTQEEIAKLSPRERRYVYAHLARIDADAAFAAQQKEKTE